MITVERFIVRSSDHDAWIAARETGVTATQVAKAATPAGMQEQLALISNPQPVVPNEYMKWGTFREPFIATRVKEAELIMPNDWLIAADGWENRWQLATPDGLSLDHKMIGEYKTGGKPPHLPAHYRRQIQWQLHVTGAEQCVYAYEQRLGDPGDFVPSFNLFTEIIDRDDKEIQKLIRVAEQLQEHKVYLSEVA